MRGGPSPVGVVLGSGGKERKKGRKEIKKRKDRKKKKKGKKGMEKQQGPAAPHLSALKNQNSAVKLARGASAGGREVVLLLPLLPMPSTPRTPM